MPSMTAAAPIAADSAAFEDLLAKGAHVFPDPLDAAAASGLLAKIRADRAFDETLFLSEAEFDADPLYVGVNPRPGRNLLDRFEAELGFVERAPMIVDALTELLGADYEILNRKIVCGVPESSVPEWLRRRILGNPVNNLGAWVRPEYRDVTYFYGIDFHQDLIDYKEREADFVTLYVYLHRVGRADAPLFLLENSHVLGGVMFPHDLTRTAPDAWTYRDGRGQEIDVRQHLLVGDTGYAAMWHACTLHGTQPDAADHERISLRYLFAKNTEVWTGIDRVNAALRGPISLAATRQDLAADGSARMKYNVVNQA